LAKEIAYFNAMYEDSEKSIRTKQHSLSLFNSLFMGVCICK
jgi:hypothetical protein